MRILSASHFPHLALGGWISTAMLRRARYRCGAPGAPLGSQMYLSSVSARHASSPGRSRHHRGTGPPPQAQSRNAEARPEARPGDVLALRELRWLPVRRRLHDAAHVVIRKGYGLACIAMAGGRSFDADLCVAWPTAEICAMSVEGAVDVAYRKAIKQATKDPTVYRNALIERFRSQLGSLRAEEAPMESMT